MAKHQPRKSRSGSRTSFFIGYKYNGRSDVEDLLSLLDENFSSTAEIMLSVMGRSADWDSAVGFGILTDWMFS